jgi:hypothetical protein
MDSVQHNILAVNQPLYNILAVNQPLSHSLRLESHCPNVRFQVLTVPSMKMTAICDIARCSVSEVDRSVRGYYCLHRQGSRLYTVRI